MAVAQAISVIAIGLLTTCAAALRTAPPATSRRGALTSGVAAAVAIGLAPRTALAAAAPAVLAQRFSFQSVITPLPPLGALSSFEDDLLTPKGSKNPSVRVRFEFPSQWSQIDRANGGITLVRATE